MTEADYVWLTNDGIDPAPVIRVVAGSEWHYAQGGWHETDAIPELTAADIEAVDVEALEAEALEEVAEEPAPELADNEQEPDPQPPAQEES